MELNTKSVRKGWGSESIWVSNDLYCSKFLNFNEGAVSSMHFHSEKHETWIVVSGEFQVTIINTEDASHIKYDMVYSNVLDIPPLTPHQVVCIKKGSILEVSTPDSVEDNYRVWPGDSQKEVV